MCFNPSLRLNLHFILANILNLLPYPGTKISLKQAPKSFKGLNLQTFLSLQNSLSQSLCQKIVLELYNLNLHLSPLWSLILQISG